MKTPSFITGITAVLLLSASTFAATFSTYQPASVVLGQPSFTATGSSSQPNRFSNPYSMAMDPTTGKVFVADTFNNRVLRFSSAAAAQNGANPEAVFGQGNFTANAANQGGTADNNTLSVPKDVFVDSGGRLWVADSGNSRVLRFDLASLVGPTNPIADRVLGQPNFTTSVGTTAQAGLNSPYGLCVDSSGVLWVADSSNNRVLRFTDAVNKANGANADGVLGQLTFATGVTGTTALGMSSPNAVTTDVAGNLWVADTNNNRVLRFNLAAAKANGAAADAALGQPDLTTATSGLSAAKMNSPYGVYLDVSTGNLWVSEYFNRRAIRFTGAANLATGAAANLVLGQPNFTTNTFATTAQGGGGLIHIAAGPNGSLLVADYDNSRVLRYTPTTTPPAPKPPIISLIGSTKRTTTKSKLVIKGLSGDLDGTVTVVKGNVNKGSYTAAVGTSPWRYTAKLKKGKNEVKIRAIDNSGLTSSFVRVTVTRK